MKKIIFILAILSAFITNAQTDGLSYQAIIIDPNQQELPGVNATGNILPKTEVTLRFTILDESGNIEYQETQDTRTDAYGMVNIIIGQGNALTANGFTDIFWGGERKDLQVEVNLNGQFADLGKSELTFLPYAFHRDIIATGYFALDGPAYWGDTLLVEGTTNLNSSLSVSNESSTYLTGSLAVDGQADLNNIVNVNNGSELNLSGSLDVNGNTQLGSNLNVDGVTNLNGNLKVNNNSSTVLTGTLTVDGQTDLNNTVNVNNGSELDASGPLNVTGNTQLDSNLNVDGVANLNGSLRVNNNSAAVLTGTLRVEGQTDLNGDVNINNGSTLTISGPLNVQGITTLVDNLIVEGSTYLNNSLDVNNNTPTHLTGTLKTDGQTTLNNTLQVIGGTDKNNIFRVNNASNSYLSGTLVVDLATNLNNGLWVNNGATTLLTGPLNVNGEINFGNNLTVNGNTNLNDALFVNNNENTHLSGNLNVIGNTLIENDLKVNDLTTLNNTLTVTNQEKMYATGTLTVNGVSNLNNSLEVTNGASSSLNGDLTVDGITLFQNSLAVTNSSPSTLSGTLNVEGTTNLLDNLRVENNNATLLTGRLVVDEATTLNELLVANGASTSLSGTLQVNGVSTLSSTLTIQGATLINNDLTVTGTSTLTSISTGSINVSGDTTEAIATFSNTNTGNGDGILIKLGRTHGAWNGSNYNSLPIPIPTAINAAKDLLVAAVNNSGADPNLDLGDVIALTPSTMRRGSLIDVNNFIFNKINSGLGLPKAFPSLNMPGQVLQNEVTFYNGNSAVCSGQYCYSICVPFVGCYTVCIPPVNVCVPAIPRIYFPGVNLPTIPLSSPTIPDLSQYMPKLPTTITVDGFPNIELPDVSMGTVSNSLTKENEYISFQDKDGRQTGVIRAQSMSDFRDNTIYDNIYVLNLLSNFVGIDLADGVAAGLTGVTNVIDEFNKIGVEYTSGNGDYAEWLERVDVSENISAGDIVGVVGGKISRDLTNAEQIMVVSHRPIILGNAPEEKGFILGNTIAFMGQVPVKVLGPVKNGDYIVASKTILGYGKAISPNTMTAEDYAFAVGRSWETNLKEGPKLVNTVVGVNDYDFSLMLTEIEIQQNNLDTKIESLEEKLERISVKITKAKQNEIIYANEK